MSKPETGFIASVHGHLPVESKLHREKMNNPYRSGTADCWYSGSGKGSHDLWIEYKFIELPASDDTMIDLVGGKKPTLSPLQQDWLKCRMHEGRNVAVVVGCKEGGVVLVKRLWERPMPTSEFRRALQSRAEIAGWIVSNVQGR